ncbi:MAG: PEGA domain-containing protein [Bacteroidales bacterium]
MKKIILLTTAVFLLSSCATIFTGTKDTISFSSTPAGAIVYIDGLEICKTPCTTSVKRSLNYKVVEFKLDGYKTRIITLDRCFNAVSILNMSTIVGWTVDAATGSLMKYCRKEYDVELEADNIMANINPYRIDIDTENNSVDIYVMDWN